MSSVTVRRAAVNDAAAFARVMGHPEVYPQLLQLPFTDADMWRQRLPELLAPGKPDVLLVAELHGEVVGNGGLHLPSQQLRRRHAMNLGIAVLPHAQGQGVGRALMQALCDYADHWAQVLRIELSVFTDNERALALYRKFGFVQEGLHRAYALRGGEYADVYSMARLHPHPPRLPAV